LNPDSCVVRSASNSGWQQCPPVSFASDAHNGVESVVAFSNEGCYCPSELALREAP